MWKVIMFLIVMFSMGCQQSQHIGGAVLAGSETISGYTFVMHNIIQIERQGVQVKIQQTGYKGRQEDIFIDKKNLFPKLLKCRSFYIKAKVKGGNREERYYNKELIGFKESCIKSAGAHEPHTPQLHIE